MAFDLTILRSIALGAGRRWRVAGQAEGAGSSCRAPSTARCAGHARMARRIAALVPLYEYDERALLPLRRCARRGRRAAPRRLRAAGRAATRERYRARRAQLTDGDASGHLRPAVHRRLPRAVPVQPLRAPAPARRRVRASRRRACTVTDLDGNAFYDLTGSYGVNLFGNDFYKECMRARRASASRELGPVLGAYHAVRRRQRARGCARSPGWTRCRSTCRAPRRSCRRCGWRAITRGARIWCASAAPITAGGATCSPASAIPSPARETYTLEDMSEDTLRVLRTRRDIACVLVNPLQALHPERRRAGRLDAGRQRPRRAASIAQAYTEWLRRLREVCTRARHRADLRRGLRRLPAGAAAARRNTSASRADMVTYGKTLGGGLPVGVVCGAHALDEALPRRPSGRHLLRARHVQLAIPT